MPANSQENIRIARIANSRHALNKFPNRVESGRNVATLILADGRKFTGSSVSPNSHSNRPSSHKPPSSSRGHSEERLIRNAISKGYSLAGAHIHTERQPCAACARILASHHLSSSYDTGYVVGQNMTEAATKAIIKFRKDTIKNSQGLSAPTSGLNSAGNSTDNEIMALFRQLTPPPEGGPSKVVRTNTGNTNRPTADQVAYSSVQMEITSLRSNAIKKIRGIQTSSGTEFNTKATPMLNKAIKDMTNKISNNKNLSASSKSRLRKTVDSHFQEINSSITERVIELRQKKTGLTGASSSRQPRSRRR